MPEKTDNKRIRVLLIEDNPGHVEMIRDALTEVKDTLFNLENVARLSAGLERLTEGGGIHVVLLDLSLPDSKGVETFIKLHTQVPEVPVLVLSAADDESIAIEAVHAGAQDYLVKGQVNSAILGRSIRYAIELNRMLKDLNHLRRERMEENMQKDQRLESLGVLAGGIAHDFNNILTVILGNVSLAKMYLSPEDESYKLLTDAEKASIRVRSLTQQLLTFSKGGAPIIKIISMGELLKDGISFALRGSNSRCEYKIPGDLCLVKVDEVQINQVINNLIINADQAMPGGGVIEIYSENISISPQDVQPLTEGQYVKIAIKDRGHGIAEEHLKKIFDPYFSTRQKGSGLGLTTAYSIIRKHGGHISVESELGTGTTFYIYLPASCEKLT